jgi:SpoVK/Ycf46/Vps4 family AAA+-type ATPase
MSDFREAVANTRPSVSSKIIEKYLAWEKEFGSY